MKARSIFYHKEMTFGSVVKMVIWQLPEPRPNGLKYHLVYAVDDVRVVVYDNETGKGDRKHLARIFHELP